MDRCRYLEFVLKQVFLVRELAIQAEELLLLRSERLHVGC